MPETFGQMQWIDVLIIATIVGSATIGFLRGLVVEVGAIAGAGAGLVMARLNYNSAVDLLAHVFARDKHLAVAAFILVFLVVFAVVLTLAQNLKALVRLSPLSVVDQVGGFLGGGVLGGILVAALLVVAWRSNDPALTSSVRQSPLASNLRIHAAVIAQLVPHQIEVRG